MLRFINGKLDVRFLACVDESISNLVPPHPTDTWKGSFYANPVVDVPTTDEAVMQRLE